MDNNHFEVNELKESESPPPELGKMSNHDASSH